MQVYETANRTRMNADSFAPCDIHDEEADPCDFPKALNSGRNR